MNKLPYILLFLISISCFGQTNQAAALPLIKGEPFNTTRKENFNGFIGTNAATVFTIDYLQINRKKQALNLRRFDKKSLNLIAEKNLFTVIDERFFNEPVEIFYQRDTIYLFSKLSGLKDKFNLIYLEVFDEYGTIITSRTIDTLDLDDEFYVTESEEKEGFLVAFHNKYDNIFEQKIHVEAIGTGGQSLWKNKLESPSALQNLEIKSIVYSINHPIYILCDYGFDMANGEREEGNLINANYAIWGYNPEEKFLKEFELKLRNKWINGIEMAYNSKGDLIVGGYINETRNYSINGIFSVQIASNFNIIRTHTTVLDRNFYAKFVEQKKLSKIKELDDISIRDLVVMDDDSYYILGEHYYKYTERNYDPRTNITTTTENYNYNSIIVAYLDKKGNLVWVDRIPKFQHSVNDGGYFSSFSTMQLPDELYLFFNDSDRNNELALDDYFNYKSLYNNRKFQVSYVAINGEGIEKRGQLLDASNGYMLRSKQNYQIDRKAMYLSGEIGKTRRLFGVMLGE